MISGTDEHGTPILVQAEKEGVTPQELVDRYNRVIVDDLTRLGLSYDLFTRTTTRNHFTVSQELFLTAHRNGYLIAQTAQGAFSPSTGRTLPDRYIEGTCPICGYDGARGDQCDNCGNQLDPQDLIDPKSRINGETPIFKMTEHFFLDLPALAGSLEKWLHSRTDWRPNVLQFALNLLKDVRPRAMTRDIDWGIPVPLPGWEENPNKRLYVWFDAVVGYLSASIEWARRFGTSEDQWREWWAAENNVKSRYFMGKDNITFHAQIWPAELMAYNGEGDKGGEPGQYGTLALPTEVVSSEFLTMEGKKFATSRGIVILLRDILDRYGPDPLRYYIAVAGPESTDTDFTWAEFVRRNNDELVAGWGNLVNRSITLAAKYFGAVPPRGHRTAAEEDLFAVTTAAFGTIGALIEQHKQKAAMQEAMRVVGVVNKYITDQTPWKLADDLDRMGTVLNAVLHAVADCNTLLSPFLPHAAQKIHELLGGEGVHSPLPRIAEVDDLDGGAGYPIITGDYEVGQRWEPTELPEGRSLQAPAPVFRKLDPTTVDEELARIKD